MINWVGFILHTNSNHSRNNCARYVRCNCQIEGEDCALQIANWDLAIQYFEDLDNHCSGQRRQTLYFNLDKFVGSINILPPAMHCQQRSRTFG
jgi:hypothetical protein